MAAQRVTQVMSEVLDYIRGYAEEKGYSPTQREIAKYFKWRSPSTANYHVKQLVYAGLLRTGEGARTITVTEEGKNYNA